MSENQEYKVRFTNAFGILLYEDSEGEVRLGYDFTPVPKEIILDAGPPAALAASARLRIAKERAKAFLISCGYSIRGDNVAVGDSPLLPNSKIRAGTTAGTLEYKDDSGVLLFSFEPATPRPDGKSRMYLSSVPTGANGEKLDPNDPSQKGRILAGMQQAVNFLMFRGNNVTVVPSNRTIAEARDEGA